MNVPPEMCVMENLFTRRAEKTQRKGKGKAKGKRQKAKNH
jgi:hypothetical protein